MSKDQGIADMGPTEAEVRAYLARQAQTMERSAETARLVRIDDSTHLRLAGYYRTALALLDELQEARQDRERVDFHERMHNVVWDQGEWIVWHRGEWRRTQSFCSTAPLKTWREAADYAMSEPPAAIDQARGNTPREAR